LHGVFFPEANQFLVVKNVHLLSIQQNRKQPLSQQNASNHQSHPPLFHHLKQRPYESHRLPNPIPKSYLEIFSIAMAWYNPRVPDEIAFWRTQTAINADIRPYEPPAVQHVSFQYSPLNGIFKSAWLFVKDEIQKNRCFNSQS